MCSEPVDKVKREKEQMYMRREEPKKEKAHVYGKGAKLIYEEEKDKQIGKKPRLGALENSITYGPGHGLITHTHMRVIITNKA